MRSTICAPLITQSNVHGVLYADRLDPFAAFSPDHLELISAVAAQTAVTVETVKAHKRLAREEVARANYSRFMPEYVVKQLLENPDSFRLGGVNQTITVLFADIRGFTAFSENENPEKVVGLLNQYFSAMTEIIFEHGGTLDKYIGDGLMAIFGAPTATPDDAMNAVKAAVDDAEKAGELNAELVAEGYCTSCGRHRASHRRGDDRLYRLGKAFGIHGDRRYRQSRRRGCESNADRRPDPDKRGNGTAAAATSFPMTKREPLTVKNRVQPVECFEVKWD